MRWLAVIIPCFLNALTLEHAHTPEELQWGLMGRTELAEDHGMLFHYPTSRYHTFWMFNCYIDLDLAFLDDEGTILEIHHLTAYPERMDPDRPVHCIKDLAKYPFFDPIRSFFQKNAVRSRHRSRYALEVPAGWFERQGLVPGSDLVDIIPGAGADEE